MAWSFSLGGIKLPDMDDADGCTTICVCLMLLNYAFKNYKNLKFYVTYIFYHNLKKWKQVNLHSGLCGQTCAFPHGDFFLTQGLSHPSVLYHSVSCALLLFPNYKSFSKDKLTQSMLPYRYLGQYDGFPWCIFILGLISNGKWPLRAPQFSMLWPLSFCRGLMLWLLIQFRKWKSLLVLPGTKFPSSWKRRSKNGVRGVQSVSPTPEEPSCLWAHGTHTQAACLLSHSAGICCSLAGDHCSGTASTEVCIWLLPSMLRTKLHPHWQENLRNVVYRFLVLVIWRA